MFSLRLKINHNTYLKHKAAQFLPAFRSAYDPQADEKADHHHAPHPTTGFGHAPVSFGGVGDKGEKR